jgi:hypothetical protein
MTDYSEPKPDSRGRNGFPSNRGDDVEASDQAILKLLHKAAETAEASGRRGLEAAQQLSNKPEITKDRIRDWKAAWSFIETRCSVPRHGFTKLVRRLRIA